MIPLDRSPEFLSEFADEIAAALCASVLRTIPPADEVDAAIMEAWERDLEAAIREARSKP